MSQSHAPYRADEVGSLLRTPPLKEARAKREKGEITPAQLKAVEDEEIRKIIAKQEGVGLQLATDGEFRRSWWHFDFLLASHRLRARGGRSWHPVPWRADQGRGPQGHGQARFPGRSSDAGALQVPEGQHQGHAEDDHPLAVGDAFPRRPRGHQQGGLPGDGRLLRRPRQALRQGHQGVLRRRLPLPAARRHGVGVPVLQGPARAGPPARRGCRQAWPASTPRSSTRR